MKELLLRGAAALCAVILTITAAGQTPTVGVAVADEETGVDTVALASYRRLLERADAGDADANFRVANTLLSGYPRIGLRKDSTEALRRLTLAAQAGLPRAQTQLGTVLYSRGETGRAIELLMRAARQGWAPAASNLGYLLAYGKYGEHNDAKARYWLRKGAEGGDGWALMTLADMALEGRESGARPALPDTARAIELYDSALVAGTYLAATQLERLIRPGALEPDSAALMAQRYVSIGALRLAIRLAYRAVETSALAQTLLAEAYARGQGLPYSHAAAMELYLRGALGGNPSAQYVLGEVLQILPDALREVPAKYTENLTPEQTTADHWLRLAAEKGVTDASAARRLLYPYATR